MLHINSGRRTPVGADRSSLIAAVAETIRYPEQSTSENPEMRAVNVCLLRGIRHGSAAMIVHTHTHTVP
ncbi:hypothetical protein GUJ93_ZPchr0014g47542 [Zizania palustris]|uniref:Uncharacterized protein n=1 Tax=Zizania palustris TaxID=103762 RepID=A0A8J5SYD0_ZIZPA|nr:hypothetical protein GUJ93_ZPchr0014g47542 [Zizania palustris]